MLMVLPCPCRRPRGTALPAQALVGFGGKKKEKELTWREQEREDMVRVQQEVLSRRKNDSWQKVRGGFG